MVYPATHPSSGKDLRSGDPDTWASFDEARDRLNGPNPPAGIGLLVTETDGLAVLKDANPAVMERLGQNLVHAEQAIDGSGLTLIVRAAVKGAATNQFVRLSVQAAYQKPAENQYAVSTPSVQVAYQAGDESVQAAYQENDQVCQYTPRTFFSSSLKNINSGEVDSERNRSAIYKNDEQGKGRSHQEQTRTSLLAQLGKLSEWVSAHEKGSKPEEWVYQLISVFRSFSIDIVDVTPDLLLVFQKIGVDVGRLQTLVAARWDRWTARKVGLDAARRAVDADPSLLVGLDKVIADEATLIAAGMARFLGRDGQFAFPGRVLAETLGLSSQQAGSDVVKALVNFRFIKMVKPAVYANKKAAEYLWIGPKGTPPRAEPESSPTVTSTATPAMSTELSTAAQTRVIAAVPATALSSTTTNPPLTQSRPGWSKIETPEHLWPSADGGFLSDAHYLVEQIFKRIYTRKENSDFFPRFWALERHRRDYERQYLGAKNLLKKYSASAISKALKKRENDWIYSLFALQLEESIVAAEAANRRTREIALTFSPQLPPPPTTSGLPAGHTRPAFAPKKSVLTKLQELET